jgi:MGT family glycosyltransferase
VNALFVGLPLHGHVNPSLPLVRALVDRGEDVVYCATAPFAAAVERAGARVRLYRAPMLSDLSPMSERIEAMASFLTEAIEQVLAHDLDGMRAEQPDYVVTDSVAPWGQWAGQVLGVPVVTSIPTFAVNRHVLAFAASSGTHPKSARLALSKIRHVTRAVRLRRRLRRRYRVAGTSIMGLMFGSSALNIVHTSREFQPRAETFDDRFVFIGPSVESRTAGDPVAWEAPPARPLVYISLGTLFNTGAEFYRRCFEAFAGDKMGVVMSIGRHVPVESLGAVPANIVVKPWLPQLDVLRRASAFVSHGGMNSVSESLHYGVPLLVIPQMGEQEVVGRRVEQLGAGLHLARTQVTADALRTGVHRLLNEPAFRDRAATLGETFKAAGGAGRGARAIVEYVRRNVPARQLV